MLFPEKICDYEYDCVIQNQIQKIKLSEISSKYIVIVFYPLDFTFVCPTEIIRFSEMHAQFEKLDTTILLCSCDSVYSHKAWSMMKKSEGGIESPLWPIVSDIGRKLCTQFNLLNEKTGTAMRSTVILNKNLNVLHISATIDPIGRSSGEILRLIKAFEFHEKNGEVCFVDFESS